MQSCVPLLLLLLHNFIAIIIIVRMNCVCVQCLCVPFMRCFHGPKTREWHTNEQTNAECTYMCLRMFVCHCRVCWWLHRRLLDAKWVAVCTRFIRTFMRQHMCHSVMFTISAWNRFGEFYSAMHVYFGFTDRRQCCVWSCPSLSSPSQCVILMSESTTEYITIQTDEYDHFQ